MTYDEWARACIAEILTTAPEDLAQKVADINAEHLFLFGSQPPPPDALKGIINIPAIQAARLMMLAFDDAPKPKLTHKAPHPYAGESWRKRTRHE